MPLIYNIFIFIFGLLVGSFLNCVIYRLEQEKSFLKGRSFCPDCKHVLRWYDLIPVFSFLALRGKCRYCGKKISWQYPAVEITTGALFLLIFNSLFGGQAVWHYYNIITVLYLLIIYCFLIVIFVFDLKHFIIPDKVVYSAIVAAFLYRLLEISLLNVGNCPAATGSRPQGGLQWDKLPALRSLGEGGKIGNFGTIINPLAAAFVAGLFFLLIVLISRGKWMGVGDIKLAFLMGLFLGFPNILVALFLAFFIGAIMGLGLIIAKQKKMGSAIPFGPFLVAGTFIAFFWGSIIINWYFNLFLI